MHKKQGSFGIFSSETKRNDFFKRGYFRITEKRKETTFLKRGYFKKWKRKRERKVVSTISALGAPPTKLVTVFLVFPEGLFGEFLRT